MKKKFISIIIATLSVSLLVGCSEPNDTSNYSNNTSNSQSNTNNSSDKDKTDNDASSDSLTSNTEDSTSNTEDSTSNTDAIKNEDKIKDLLTSAINELYNTDYSIQENKDLSKEFINKNFSENGSKNLIKTINEYDSSFKSSDLLITNVKEIKSNSDNYVKSYEVRYNVTITSGKPSSYSDLIAAFVEDNNGNLFIDSLNENNF